MNNQGSTLTNKAFDTNHPFPAWLGDIRQQAIQQFGNFSFPNKKEERWKYIDFPNTITQWPTIEDNAYFNESIRTLIQEKIIQFNMDSVAVFFNGEFVSELSKLDASYASAISQGIPSLFSDMFDQTTNLFEAINTIRFLDGLTLSVSENQPSDMDVIWITLPGQSENAIHTRNCIKLAPHSTLNLRFHTITPTSFSCFSNTISHFEVGDNATLNLSLFYDEMDRAIHFAKYGIKCSENSTVKMANFNRSVGTLRIETEVQLTKPGANVEIIGLNVLENEQCVHQVTTVNHLVGQCQCEQVTKSILNTESCADYFSTVNVAPDAQLTVSNQLNQTLMLSDDAQSYSRPQLNIDADDVKCAHGATVGQLNNAELFYLKSRGISEHKARQLLIRGFAQSVISQVSDPLSQSNWTQHLNKAIG